jgi:hypothetical protein
VLITEGKGVNYQNMAKKRVLVFAIPLLILFSIMIGGASAATVSHPASQVEAGTFGVGDFFFPGRVGINVTAITQTLDINGSINISGKYYGDGSALIGVSTTGGGNDTYNYVMNQSGAWIGMLGSSEGSLKIDLTDILAGTLNTDVIGTNLNLSGYLNVLGNLNVSGTSYLGSIIISADNITTNSILSKNGNVTFYNNAGSAIAIMTSDGKVGIGTLNPASLLHISGNVGNNAFIKLNNNATTRMTSGLQLLSQGTAQFTLYNDVNAVNTREFSVYDEVAGASRLTIDSSGKVGIGTGSPQKTFHVKVGTNQHIRFQSFESEMTVDTVDDSQNNVPFRMYASEFNLMNGNVGIGTSSPSYKLQVEGNVSLNSTLYVTNAGYVGIRMIPGQELSIKSKDSNSDVVEIKRSGADEKMFSVTEDGSGNGYLDVYSTGASSKVRLNSNGDSYFNGGKVTMPNQTRVRAYRSGSAQSVPNNQDVTLNFTAEDYDVGNNFDANVSNKFTAPVAGYYLVVSRLTFTAGGAETYILRINKNGGYLTNLYTGSSAAGSHFIYYYDILKLAANDWISVGIHQQAAGNRDFAAGSEYSYLAISLLG